MFVTAYICLIGLSKTPELELLKISAMPASVNHHITKLFPYLFVLLYNALCNAFFV